MMPLRTKDRFKTSDPYLFLFSPGSRLIKSYPQDPEDTLVGNKQGQAGDALEAQNKAHELDVGPIAGKFSNVVDEDRFAGVEDVKDHGALGHCYIDLGGLLGTLANECVHVYAGATRTQEAKARVVHSRENTL